MALARAIETLEAIGRRRALTPEESAELARLVRLEADRARGRRKRLPQRLATAKRRLARLRTKRCHVADQIAHWRAKLIELEAQLYPEATIAAIEKELAYG